jgi:hypothetical protein
MLKDNRTILAIAAACVAALLIGVGFGLVLPQGPRAPTGEPGQTGPSAPQDNTTTTTSACDPKRQTPLLDESKIPETTTGLEATMTNAAARYFTCEPLTIEQFSRGFATLAVAIAQYAPDPGCFKEDTEAADKTWIGQKTWADKQGGASLLTASLRVRIKNVLACLPPEQQPLFFVDFVHAFAFAAGGHAMQTFVNPTFKGQRIDHCLDYARECDDPAALAWCQRYGYTRTMKWEWLNTARSITLGDQKTCNGTCGAFTTIVCAE